MAPVARDVDPRASHDGPVTNGSDDSVVRLELPVDSRYIRVARLVASGLGAIAGLDVDGVDDLRIAVDELCAAIIDGSADGAELTVSYREVDGVLLVDGVCDDASSSPPELHAVARELLAMLADEYEFGVDGAGRTFRMVKRPRATE